MPSIAGLISRAFRRRRRGDGAVLIVGMHRSGTSFLTGSMQEAGLALGRHSEWNPHNTRGNRENPDVVAFHEELLANRGCSWDAPPEGILRWTRAEIASARELVRAWEGLSSWGFKDPRTLLFVEGWEQLLPGMRCIGIFRHPAAVARSLAARGGMPEQKALDLWLHYNRRLLALHDRRPFPILCFDEPEEQLRHQLDVVLESMGLKPPSGERFWAAELRHHDAFAEALPESTATTYLELRRRAWRASGAGAG